MSAVKNLVKRFMKEETAIGTIEIILILVEKYFISYSL
ncbi:hypothetical protein SAMN05216249_10923 [Acetitomaculum ruminis DSM 5522]|uniref:Uncharacterized protein n=1 Tax=Acetitomaculum ruminis DSM 5522 TaxID=1120918 RepID=A0A1I0Y9T6_9FIRM|nr:hypothetical protein SAMN05216249_10923 [Acetitomaculum ruminis DSM 5522]